MAELRNAGKESALSLERLRSCLRYDVETGDFYRVSSDSPNPRVTANEVAGGMHSKGYRVIGIGRDRFLAHRLAWFYVYGEWPAELDHINRDRADNRICNLRPVSHKHNTWNLSVSRRSKTGLLNISTKRGWHHVRICRNGSFVCDRKFNTLAEAIAVRDFHVRTFQKEALSG